TAGSSASTTHVHNVSYDSETGASSIDDYDQSPLEVGTPTNTHTHGSPLSATSIDAILALPPYYELKVISSSTPSSIPSGAIAIFDTSDLPTNWATYTDAAGYIIRGGPNASTTVSTAHTHSNVAFTIAAASASQNTEQSGHVSLLPAHTHSVSGGTSDSSDTLPPYIGVILAKATVDITSFTDVIAMFDAAPTGDWSAVSAINSDKFIQATTTTYGLTGGSSTHSHPNKAFTTDQSSDTFSTGDTGPGQIGAGPTHTHSATVSFSSGVANLPPYLDTVFAKYSPVVGPTLNQRSYRWQNDDGVNVTSTTNSASADQGLTMERGERATLRLTAATTTDYKLQLGTATSTCDQISSWTDAGSATAISYSYGLAASNNDNVDATVTDTTNSCGGTCTNGFTSGTWHEAAATTSSHTLSTSQYTEFGFMVHTANAVLNTTYCLRLYNQGDSTALDNYYSYATTTIVASDTKTYSKEPSSGSLPSSTSSLTYYLDNTGYTAVATNDNTNYDQATSSSAYPIFQFNEKHTNNTDLITVDWDGQTSMDCSTSTVQLQVYNINQASWDSLATSTGCTADTDFALNASITTSPGDYYDSNYWVYARVYQDTESQTLETDYINFTFTGPAPTLNQRSYRWQNDDGVNVTSTTNSASADQGLTMERGERASLRLQIDNTGTLATTTDYNLQYKTEGAGCSAAETWLNVTSTAAISYSYGLAASNNDNVDATVTDATSSCGDG
ncbi:MAG: hypothetical protein ACXABY_36940, partial [Candidatus Thorarchaeota archaeon]